MKVFAGALAIVVAVAAPARAQEVGVYGAGLDANLTNVLRFGYGGGVSFTALYHARVGVRVDGGLYEGREHYTAPICTISTNEPQCVPEVVTSRTPFGMLDAMAVVSVVDHPGMRIYLGAGASHLSLSNEQRGAKSDSVYSPKQSASGTGPVFMASIVGRPQWRYHFGGEATILVHRTGQLDACGTGNQGPFCGSLNVTEFRLAIVYAPRWAVLGTGTHD